MKIAFILSTCIRSGPFIVAADIINNLTGKVEYIDVFYLKEGEPKLPMKARSRTKVKLNSKTDLSSYDVIHSHGFLGDVYAYRNRRSIRGKWITTLHQKIEPVYSLNYNKVVGVLQEFLWLKMVAKSDLVVVLTEDMANYYRQKRSMRKTKVNYVYNGATPIANPSFVPPQTELEKLEKLKSRYKILGITATVTFLKGIDRVIEALTLPGSKDLALLVLGEGPSKEKFIAQAQELGVSDRVLFLGFKENVIDYFKYFDVYIMSSRSEGFGLCLIDAASQKVPVVCNDLSVFRELFSDEEVVRFDLADLHTMINAVRTALERRTEMSEKFYDTYRRKFSAEVMANKYLELYQLASKRKIYTTGKTPAQPLS